MERLICWLIKRLVNLHYKRTHFYAWSWGIDENTDINILSEESYLNYHRYGTKETTFNANQRFQSVESVENVEVDTTQTKNCPWCNAIISETDKYCHECGWYLGKGERG